MKEHRRESYSNIQGPFHWSIEWMCNMPMHLWCQLLPQVERRLLLLRQSWVNPGMSAYAHVYQGQHEYSKHPFVPIGMEAMVHEKPLKRRTLICPGHVVRALPMPNNLDGGLAQSADVMSSLVQSQVPHPPINHSSRQDHGGSYLRPSEDAYHWSPTATT